MKDTGRRPVILAVVAVLTGLAVALFGSALTKAALCSTMVPATLAGTVVFLLSLAALGRTYFARRQCVEEDLVEEYRRGHGTTELFEDADEAVRLAARANAHYVKYFIPFFTIVLGAGLAVVSILCWRRWSAVPVLPLTPDPLQYSAAAAVLFFAAIGAGSYFLGASRAPGCRWLRPAGAWLFFSGLLFLLGIVTMLCEHFGWAGEAVDVRLAKTATALLIVLAGELVLSFVIEFYRPRMPGEAERPLPESRLLSLFTEPGGVARNVAASLDYQFGFQVSEVWFYRFLEKAVVPLFVLMVVTFWLQTCLVVVSSEENGIRECFGRVKSREPLPPGLYFKYPWPFARIYTFPVEHVQELPIGYVPGEPGQNNQPPDPMEEELQGDPTGRVIVWSKKHHKEETKFIVASHAQGIASEDTEADNGIIKGVPVSISFITASIPLYFKVKDLYQYAYLHHDARKTLEELATREVVRYLATVDFVTVISAGRAEGAHTIAERIQNAADEVQLGIEVVFVGLQGIHPPVKVGAAFDDVVAALEEKHEKSLLAEEYAIRRKPEAEGQALTKVTEAEAYRDERIKVSKAESERFEKQLLGYRASPDLFTLNSFLDVLETEGARVRKFVVAAGNSTEVYILNLEEKLRPDLLDLDLDAKEQ